MQIVMTGICHRNASLAVREAVSLTRPQQLRLLTALRRQGGLAECLILSTCNRTEAYAVAEPGRSVGLDGLRRRILAVREAAVDLPDALWVCEQGADACRHLLRVAASLDSRILGEKEILGQVKEAYRTACEARTNGPLLNKLMHRAFRVGKRVHAETALGDGAAGLPQAVMQLVRAGRGDLSGATLLVVGAGTVAEQVIRTALNQGLTGLVVANRTPAKAAELVDYLVGDSRPGGRAGMETVRAECIALDEAPTRLADVDAAVCTTRSPDHALTAADCLPVLARRRRPLTIVDLALPRDVDPQLGELELVRLHNIDEVDERVGRNLAGRRRAVPAAEAIVEEELARLASWHRGREAAPTLKMLQARFEEIVDREARNHCRVHGGDPTELARFGRRLCGRILNDPIAFMKERGESAGSSEPSACELVRQVFNLRPSALC